MNKTHFAHGTGRFLVAYLLLILSACNQPGGRRELLPVVFSTTPTLDQLVQRINANTDAVQRLHAQNATLSVAGLPALRADLALEPPRRFRLIGETPLTGSELDLGSNDEMFWIWVKRNDPPAVYYSRHDQFDRSAVRRMFPIDPKWLNEALGLVRLEPGAAHQGPYPAGASMLVIHSPLDSPQGPLTKSTYIHAQFGYVARQTISDAQGRMLASADMSNHHFDQATSVTLPRTVAIRLPGAQLDFTLNMGEYSINQLNADPRQLWAMPQRSEQYVDLADPRLTPPQPTVSPQGMPMQPLAPLPTNAPIPQPLQPMTMQPMTQPLQPAATYPSVHPIVPGVRPAGYTVEN